MPKIWNLQPIIIFSSRIECSPVPSRNMTRSTLKGWSKSWVWVSEVKKNKIDVWCLAWQQIKDVDSLNHPKLLTNHNCLIKWSYLLKGYILWSERSNGSQKIHVCRGCRRTLCVPPTGLSEITLFCKFLCSFRWNMFPEANHKQHSQNSHFQCGHHEKMLKN